VRVANRLLAFVLALALLATGVILIVEVIAANTDHQPVIFDWHAMFRWGQRNGWNATSVEITCGIVALVGLLLLLPQLRRSRPRRFPVDVGDQALDAGVTRKGLRTAIRSAVEDVDGVGGSSIAVGRRRVRVEARSAARTPDVAASIEPNVRQAAERVTEQLMLRQPRRVSVSVEQNKKAES
jgi:hypothetical protein